MTHRSSEEVKRRSEPRVAAQLPVSVVGVDLRSVVFNEQAETLNVSRGGVCLKLDTELAPGVRLSITARDARQRTHLATFETRWSRGTGGRYVIGARVVSTGDWLALLEQAQVLTG